MAFTIEKTKTRTSFNTEVPSQSIFCKGKELKDLSLWLWALKFHFISLSRCSSSGGCGPRPLSNKLKVQDFSLSNIIPPCCTTNIFAVLLIKIQVPQFKFQYWFLYRPFVVSCIGTSIIFVDIFTVGVLCSNYKIEPIKLKLS